MPWEILFLNYQRIKSGQGLIDFLLLGIIGFMETNLTNSLEETQLLAKKLAATLKGGETIGLIGDLGAGKTVFVQGLAKGLGIKETVNSPTFVLMKLYAIHNPRSTIHDLVHIDAYRLNNSEELKNIGLEEYLGRKDRVVVIEWAEKVKDLLPKSSVIIEFKEGQNENQRIITIDKNCRTN